MWRREDPVHRARLAMGERLHRELQWQAPGRASRQGGLLHADGSESVDCPVPADLQPYPAAQLPRLSAPCTRDHPAYRTDTSDGWTNIAGGTKNREQLILACNCTPFCAPGSVGGCSRLRIQAVWIGPDIRTLRHQANHYVGPVQIGRPPRLKRSCLSMYCNAAGMHPVN